MVLTRYKRMNPNLASHFRNFLGKSGGSYEVVRKRILIKAAEAAGIKLDRDQLEGHVGVVFAEQDPITVTKAVYQFRQENEDVLQILGGRFEGSVCTAADVEQISKLPSKDEMRAQFLGLLEAPLSQTLSVMEALLTSVMHCLENKSKSMESDA
jgi:large subunit ribosomal protein L10